MAMKIPKGDDSILNMTPMIDIVFQLILFFLFSLKFRSQEYRIESTLPKDRGIQATPQLVTDIPSIKVSLFRMNAETPLKAFTKIKLAGSEILMPPYQWDSSSKTKDTETEDDRDRRYAAITQKIKDLFGSNKELKGEIETPRPFGDAVPHADVMRILDCFVAAGVKDVNFVGTPAPLPKAKGGHGP